MRKRCPASGPAREKSLALGLALTLTCVVGGCGLSPEAPAIAQPKSGVTESGVTESRDSERARSKPGYPASENPRGETHAEILGDGTLGSGEAAGETGLAGTIETILARPEFRASTFAILLTRLGDGKVLYKHNADRLLPPASTTKLVTCAGALLSLGADFRFETPVLTAAAPEAGIVEGDLVLVASGDPNLSQRLQRAAPGGPPGDHLLFADEDHSYASFSDGDVVPGDPMTVLSTLASAVARNGVREIRGDVVIDAGLFAEARDDFAGRFSAICVNDNLLDVFIRPGEVVGSPVDFNSQPRSKALRLRSQATTLAAGSQEPLWVDPDSAPGSFVLRGGLALDSGEVLRTARFRHPEEVAARLFHDALENAGIEIKGQPRTDRLGPTAYAAWIPLVKHTSAPLSETVRVILKTSQNLHATMLPVVVGALRGERGDRRSGFGVLREMFQRRGLSTEGIAIDSGSGGGRADHVTARFLVNLLRFMARQPRFESWAQALPVGGVDGTLSRQYVSSPLAGRLHAKTGTLLFRGSLEDNWIYAAKALAGYLELEEPTAPETWVESNRTVAFAILVQGTAGSDRHRLSRQLFQAQGDILKAVLMHQGRMPPSF